MSWSAGMTLVFRLGATGFALAVEDLVEIREESPDRIVSVSVADLPRMGRFPYRTEEIPVIDLACLFHLAVTPRAGELLTLLVLTGETGYWAAPVDRVEGIFPAATFSYCPAPLLAQLPGPRPYGDLALWKEELLVRCDALWLEQCWNVN